MEGIVRSHKHLEVYKISYDLALEIHNISKSFPKEEIYSLVSQIRRSSRSVSANIAEAFRKRRYEKAFVAKLSDSEGEAAETQVWLDMARDFDYISASKCDQLSKQYDQVIGMLVNMIRHPEKWSI